MNNDPTLGNLAVMGVDPGTMISGMQRLAPWFIRVLLFQVIYPLVLYFQPNGETVRSPARGADDVLEAAFGDVGQGGSPPKDLYFNGRQLTETGPESKDTAKRQLVWSETVKYAGLKEGDTVLVDWK